MKKYYIVSIEDYTALNDAETISTLAMEKFNSTGIEDFSIDESRVDEILGERSYSGADLPLSVVDEVEDTVLSSKGIKKAFYFSTRSDAQTFYRFATEYTDKIVLNELDEQDWNEEWKKSYGPILVSDELEIIPSWDEKTYESHAKNKLYIYPGMGFGTGSHETTYLCLKLLMEIDNLPVNAKCMDYGCGSGILGIALGLICPKAKIDLYDIDEGALKNCEQNVQLNKADEKNIRYLLPQDQLSFFQEYNIVFANILKNVLEHECEKITDLVGNKGILIVSGLLQGQEETIIRDYEQQGLTYIKTLNKGDWVAVKFERK